MKRKHNVVYTEPSDYFPEELRQRYSLGEYAEGEKEPEEEFLENCGGIQPLPVMPPIFGEDLNDLTCASDTQTDGACALGAIFGDVVGSVFEFNNIKTKDFELFSEKSKFTDDSVMTLAVAEALYAYDAARAALSAERGKAEHDLPLFRRILVSHMHVLGELYPDAGYGGSFFLWLAKKSREPYGSFGNGSAMRVSPVAWYARSLKEATELAKASAEVTHDHPEGIKGAVVTAGAIYLARTGATTETLRDFVSQYYPMDFTLDEIRSDYRFNETCQETVPQAMAAFLEASSFEDAIRNAISLGGDSDTLAAITGSVAEAYYGMTEEEKGRVLSRLDGRLLAIVQRFRTVL